MPDVETIPVSTVSNELHVRHGAVLSAMLNGTLPIGFVTVNEKGRRHGVVVKARWDAWKNAHDLTVRSKDGPKRGAL